MAINPSYLIIPLSGKNLVEGVGIRCKSLDEAEAVALTLGFRKFKIVQEIEMISVVKDKALKESKDNSL